jgi:hypothetical protein
MPIIDVHAHLGSWAFPTRSVTVEATSKLLEKFDIEKCALASAEAVVSNFVEGNRKLSEMINGQPRMLGYMVVNPNYVEQSVEEMRKYLSKSQFVGIYFHNEYCGQPINTLASKEVLTAARRYGKPVMAHTWGRDNVEALVEVAQEYRALNFIMAHMGGHDWHIGIDAAKENLNIFVVPTSPHNERDKLRSAVVGMGERGDRRVLFGSGHPLTSPASALGMIRDADLTPRQRERILYLNAKELFGL